MNYALTSFNTGQVTLPKKWRDKVGTRTFIAEEREDGLLIRPISSAKDTTVYYENAEGFGILAPDGVDPTSIIARIRSLHG